jgi:hypothetical protein
MVSMSGQALDERVLEYPEKCLGNNLVSNSQRMIYQFNFESECYEALAESRLNAGRFCDAGKLIRENGSQAYQFSFNSDCLEALQSLKLSRHGLFCQRGTLVHYRKSVLAYMTFLSQCQSSVLQANSYQGHFCHKSLLMNVEGRILKDFTFESSCLEALMRIGL